MKIFRYFMLFLIADPVDDSILWSIAFTKQMELDLSSVKGYLFFSAMF